MSCGASQSVSRSRSRSRGHDKKKKGPRRTKLPHSERTFLVVRWTCSSSRNKYKASGALNFHCFYFLLSTGLFPTCHTVFFFSLSMDVSWSWSNESSLGQAIPTPWRVGVVWCRASHILCSALLCHWIRARWNHSNNSPWRERTRFLCIVVALLMLAIQVEAFRCICFPVQILLPLICSSRSLLLLLLPNINSCRPEWMHHIR